MTSTARNAVIAAAVTAVVAVAAAPFVLRDINKSKEAVAPASTESYQETFTYPQSVEENTTAVDILEDILQTMDNQQATQQQPYVNTPQPATQQQPHANTPPQATANAAQKNCEHNWIISSKPCVEPRRCSKCGYEDWSSLTGHNWVEANCANPKTCRTCALSG